MSGAKFIHSNNTRIQLWSTDSKLSSFHTSCHLCGTGIPHDAPIFSWRWNGLAVYEGVKRVTMCAPCMLETKRLIEESLEEVDLSAHDLAQLELETQKLKITKEHEN